MFSFRYRVARRKSLIIVVVDTLFLSLIACVREREGLLYLYINFLPEGSSSSIRLVSILILLLLGVASSLLPLLVLDRLATG